MSPRFFTPTLLLRKSDAELAALVRDGHEAAFSAIVLRHRSHLLRHCRGTLRDDRAEDAVQQTFVRALQALRAGTEVRELRPWLCRIARNVALDELGATRGDHAELNDDWEDRGRTHEVERRANLRDALLAVEALPARQRTALLRSVAGEPPAAIAQELGVTSMAVRQLLHRARVSVRAAVQALLPPPLLWFSRRLTTLSEKVPRTAGASAGAAPLATKVAVAVVASAGVAAPAAVLRHVLTHHANSVHHRRAIVAQPPAPRLVAAAPRIVAAAQPVAPKRAFVATGPDRPRPEPKHASAPPPRPSPPAAVSATSPNSAPVGTGPAAPSAPSSAAVAADVGGSGPSGSGSANPGPISTASASGPTGGAGGEAGATSTSSSGPSGG